MVFGSRHLLVRQQLLTVLPCSIMDIIAKLDHSNQSQHRKLVPDWFTLHLVSLLNFD